jgi:hypothetical protein
MEKEEYELWKLDFTGVDKNEQVKAQGITICIRTKRKGFFSLNLEKFPSRQDLAKKTFVTNLRIDWKKKQNENQYENEDGCQCTFTQSMLGEGCRKCQPQNYIDRLHDQIEDQYKEINQLKRLNW